jgi:crotonobetainyl-CoA:carnitine CoA-transferase CaiB-like acyl-CoA transferase
MAPLALSGIRVLDLSRVLAGPLCTMILGDLGADVLKVERPVSGDDTRGWGPPFDAGGESAYFLSTNRNKTSIAADLGAAGDCQLIVDLIRDAHVVVENFRPGVLERLGVRRTTLLSSNPALIWCTISGFGDMSDRPGYDFVVQAEAGWMAITGDPSGPPMKSGVALADIVAGKDAAIAILASLLANRSGAASTRHISISLLDSARAALVNVAQNSLVSGEEARRWGNAHPNLVPYQLFRASDREIVIAVGTDKQWKECAREVQLHSLADDEALATNAGRLAQRARIVEAFAAVLERRTAAEWIAALRKRDVPCGLVRGILDVIRDTSDASPITGMPSSVGGNVRLPPPRLDEHGALIRQHGWAAFHHLP